MTAELKHKLVSPHFTLGQFLCKQESGYPRYLVIHSRTLHTLELVLDEVNRHGFPASTLFVMSGYRTPDYNHSIGNVANSRHVYGDGTDIFVDSNPADGVMDDLNRDGRINGADNDVLAGIVERALRTAGPGLLGSVGKYPNNAVHGPFVHVDLRGYRARW